MVSSIDGAIFLAIVPALLVGIFLLGHLGVAEQAIALYDTVYCLYNTGRNLTRRAIAERLSFPSIKCVLLRHGDAISPQIDPLLTQPSLKRFSCSS